MNRKRNVLVVPVIVLLSLAFAHPALAQPELDERISLELEDAPAGMVLGSFGSILKREAQVDPKIDGTISIELHNVRVETALQAVCESVGCLWRMDAKSLRFVPDPDHVPPKGRLAVDEDTTPAPGGLDDLIDISLLDADVRETLTSFGRISGHPVVIDEEIEGVISLELTNAPARKALDAVCEVHDCVWEVVESEQGTVLHIEKVE